MIRTLLFDLGNVLVHFSHEQMCAQMGSLCGKSADEIRDLLFEGGLQQDFERGVVSEAEFHHRFERAVGVNVSLDALRQAGSDIFVLNSPMPAILKRLKQRRHRLVLLSNTSVAHFEFVGRTFDILGQFDDYVVSYQVGAVKPEPAIFEAALAKIECDPGECFYTDDIADYIQAARGYGLQAELFTDATTLGRQLAQRGIEVSVGE